MRYSRIFAGVTLGVLALAGAWLMLRHTDERAITTSEPTEVEVVEVIDVVARQDAAPVESATTEQEEPEPPWVPSGSACHRHVKHGATFEEITDVDLAAVIVDGYDVRARRLPTRNAFHPVDGAVGIASGRFVARDCRGDRVEYDDPLTTAQRVGPLGNSMGKPQERGPRSH